MRRVIWSESGIELDDREPGPLRGGWARLRVVACGICGSDLHLLHAPATQRPVGTSPGHELAGTLVDGPSDLADVVYAVSPNVTCGVCEFCRTGRTNLCGGGGPTLGLGGDGGLAELVDAPLANLAPVPDGVAPAIAAMTEPLAVGLRGVNLGDPSADSRVLVLGAGTIGLCAALVARDRAVEVAITARHPHQRKAAEALGVTVLDEDELVPWGKEHRPDVVIESVGGAAETVPDAIRVARRGGRIVVLGSFMGRREIDFTRLQLKELALLTSFCYGTGLREPELTTAARLTGRWQTELGAMTTHQYPLDDAVEAFAAAGDKTSGSIKVTLVP